MPCMNWGEKCMDMGFPVNFPKITGKYNKTYGMGEVWEIDPHTFPIPMVLCPIRFPSYGVYT